MAIWPGWYPVYYGGSDASQVLKVFCSCVLLLLLLLFLCVISVDANVVIGVVIVSITIVFKRFDPF